MTDPIDAAAEAEWHAATAAAPAKCKCSHSEDAHAVSTGRCRFLSCGCTKHRPREVKARTPQSPAATPPALPELVPCPSCDGTGNELKSTDPDWRFWWCGTCLGLGLIEIEEPRR